MSEQAQHTFVAKGAAQRSKARTSTASTTTPLTKEDERDIEHLAAAVRLAARFGWTEGVRSHFSVLLSGNRIAVQNENVPWSLTTAQDIVVFDASAVEQPANVSISAFVTHRDLHAQLGPRAKCILHLHTPMATALSCTVPGRLEMIHQNSAYFYGVVGYYDYPETGTQTTREVCEALVACFGKANRVLLQANHGVLVIGGSVASTFDDLYYFETACAIQMRCYQSGRPLKQLHEHTCKLIMEMRDKDREEYGRRHFNTLLMELAHSDACTTSRL